MLINPVMMRIPDATFHHKQSNVLFVTNKEYKWNYEKSNSCYAKHLIVTRGIILRNPATSNALTSSNQCPLELGGVNRSLRCDIPTDTIQDNGKCMELLMQQICLQRLLHFHIYFQPGLRLNLESICFLKVCFHFRICCSWIQQHEADLNQIHISHSAQGMELNYNSEH